MTALLPDQAERERAATTFDRNVVVTAGAGTGKTRLLVDRLVHLLMREPETKLTRVVALTFTNKAANEMKLRLRERLEDYLAMQLDAEPANAGEAEAREEVRALTARYHLSKAELDRRARDALTQIERSDIGTIHSFAATLLRLYPLESGVDPQFVEDDGARFERLFDDAWSVWLDGELGRASRRAAEWKRVLRKIGLDEARALAASLSGETVDLKRLGASARKEKPPKPVRDWLRSLEKTAAALIERHPEARSNEKIVAAAREVLDHFLATGAAAGCATLRDDPEALSGAINRTLKGWSDEDCDDAREIRRVARALCSMDSALCRDLVELLIPFAESFRAALAREGIVSFDGLLARARALVRDHAEIREQLKRKYDAILIDEFQDTDPIQYEILIYLAERPGESASDWQEVTLQPGKIFVVGDPKQSIYAFRRADIEAYLEVVEKIIKAQDGVECRLSTNFRSHGKILDVVNGVFSRLIRPKAGLQPEYIAIEPSPPKNGGGGAEPLPFRKVSLRKVESEGWKLDIELARRLEAESLARWLDEEIIGRAEIVDGGKKTTVRAKHVAILLRKLTDVHHYLEPLRRRALRYVVEGERNFYAVQEIIDAVNLLRAVDNPHDRLALVGVLRSPLGGLSDAEIFELHRERLLDYRLAGRSKEGGRAFAKVTELYEILRRLNREIRSLPVGEAVARVFDSAPVRLLAAASFHGEQAVANLEKLRQQADLLGREGLGTLKDVIARLGKRVLQIEEEAESALGEENLDAIRILSIHKAKGLEFPVVVLAGCHAVPNQAGDHQPAVLQDWSTNLSGLRTKSYWSPAGLYITEKERRREREEQKRALYVAMTRACEHLMISCAPGEKARAGSYLRLLEDALGAIKDRGALAAGSGAIEVEIARESLGPPGRPRSAHVSEPLAIDWKSYAALWRRRATERDAALARPRFLTPTLLKTREAELTESLAEREKSLVASELPRRLGELAHRFLEYWDFAADEPSEFRARLEPFLAKWIEPRYRDHGEQFRAELEEILEVFFASPVYRELRASKILGREVPLVMPWDGQVMEGVIDLLYEKDGRVFIADYKTDRVERSELAEAAARYHYQVEIYSEAARRVLKKDIAGFKLIFLRLGEAVEAR
jgi:ATP-dependent helicase/nuclease subunit A